MTNEHRCVASVRLPNGQLKRCTRAVEHETEMHLWVESMDRVGGNSLVVTWAGNADVEESTRIGYVNAVPA